MGHCKIAVLRSAAFQISSALLVMLSSLESIGDFKYFANRLCSVCRVKG